MLLYGTQDLFSFLAVGGRRSSFAPLVPNLIYYNNYMSQFTLCRLKLVRCGIRLIMTSSEN